MKRNLLIIATILCWFSSVKDVKAQWITIPDANFAAYLSTNYPTCMNGNQMDTTCSGIVNAWSLNVNSLNISDLWGIQYFDNLSQLSCQGNHLQGLPYLPPYLWSLSCQNNQITSLGPLPNGIHWLFCSDNNIHNWYWPLPSQLEWFTCNNNNYLFPFSSFPTLPANLQQLECRSYGLTSLPNIPASLRTLICGQNNLTSLPALPDSLYQLRIEDNPNLVCLPEIKKIGTFIFNNTGITCVPNYGTVYSSSPLITSLPLCSQIAISPAGPTTFCIGGSVVLNAGASTGNSYQWFKNGTIIPGANLASYTATATGNYAVSNACGSPVSSPIVVTAVVPSCSITGNGIVCTGGSVQWCAPAGLASYAWSTGSTSQCATLTTAGTYTVTVTDATGCTSTCSKTAVLYGSPVCSITGNGINCPGSSTQWCAPFGGGSGVISYLWSTGETTWCSTLSIAGNYTVTVTHQNGCTSSCSKALVVTGPTCSISGNGTVCSGSSVQWCAPAGLSSYSWSTGSTLQCVTLNLAGTYTVVVWDANGCASTCSKTLSWGNPLCSITGNGTICSGSSTQWCAPAGVASYLWNNGATSQCRTLSTSGTYTVTVTNSTGCSSSCTKKLTVGSKPARPGTITATGGNTKVCAGDSKTYSISTVSGAVSYQWTPPAGGVIASGQGTISVSVNFTGGFVASDSLKVAAVNSCGVTGDYRALKITKGNAPAKPSVITGPITGVCGNNGVPYSVTNVAGISYNWTSSTTNASIAGGQGTSTCTFNFSSSPATILIAVTPANVCGTGTTRDLYIKGWPSNPGNITGATTVCANQFGVSYSISPVASASNYNWVGPTGSHISDGITTSSAAGLLTTATSITVNYGANAGIVKVKAVNSCGQSSYKSITVAFNCREAANSSSFDVNLFPNPADDELTVSFNSREQSSYSIKVNDIIGNTLLVKKGVSEKGENNFKLSLEDITPGVYLVEIKNGDMSRVLKLVVN